MNTITKETRDTRSRAMIIGVAAAGVLLLALSIFAIVRLTKEEPSEPLIQSESAGLVYDDAAVEGGWEHLSQEEIEASLNEKVEAGMINISMNTAPIFADGTSEGNVMIVNETINNYPQMVEIIRNDTQEVIYTSKAIAVGSKIESAKLAVDLDAGTYECTAMFHSLDPDTGAVLGSAGAVITVTVNN